MGFWNYFRIISGILIIVVASIWALVMYYKEIDPETTWIYGIYVVIQIILFSAVLIGLEQYWLNR